jgi:hypothetical protein
MIGLNQGLLTLEFSPSTDSSNQVTTIKIKAMEVFDEEKFPDPQVIQFTFSLQI